MRVCVRACACVCVRAYVQMCTYALYKTCLISDIVPVAPPTLTITTTNNHGACKQKAYVRMGMFPGKITCIHFTFACLSWLVLDRWREASALTIFKHQQLFSTVRLSYSPRETTLLANLQVSVHLYFVEYIHKPNTTQILKLNICVSHYKLIFIETLWQSTSWSTPYVGDNDQLT